MKNDVRLLRAPMHTPAPSKAFSWPAAPSPGSPRSNACATNVFGQALVSSSPVPPACCSLNTHVVAEPFTRPASQGYDAERKIGRRQNGSAVDITRAATKCCTGADEVS